MAEDDTAKNVADKIVRPALAEEVPALVDFMAAQAKECGFEPSRIEEVRRACEEAFGNILKFAFADRQGEITISCVNHDTGALIATITDNGAAFNMLVSSCFPERKELTEDGCVTTVMRRAIKNIEYRRDANRNILIFTISR